MAGRDNIIVRLGEDLMGPMSGDELLDSYPSDVYLTGILFPQKSQVAQDEADQLQVEGAADIDSNDVSKDEISLATVKRPASAGLSFVVESEKGKPVINVLVSAGVYRQEPESARKKDDDDREAKTPWRRNQVSVELTDMKLDFESKDYTDEQTGVEGLGLYVRTSPWNGRLLVTVAMINNRVPNEEYERSNYEELCFFQTSITVTPGKKTRFYERPLGGSAIDEDTRMAQLIYRDVAEYAVGHTCSADWDEEEGQIELIRTTWLPRTVVKAMSSAGVNDFQPLIDKSNGPILGTQWLSEASGEKLVTGLKRLPEIYSDWLEQQQRRIPDLDAGLQPQAREHIKKARQVQGRMEEAIGLIESDTNVQIAFRLANRAINIQRAWAKPEGEPLVWRPFQLGFILLSLVSVAEDRHEYRNVADLLWFPTGGGKTEAYLGLIAFTVFLRRLRYKNNGAGVTSFMRYTLRLLTIQQFQRASALICACEAIRQGQYMPADIKCDLADVPVSIGLWVGGEATPNDYGKAEKSLRDDYARSRPDQLKYCPRHTQRKLIWRADPGRKEIHAYCPEAECLWNETSDGLPVWTVDDDIYRVRPSLVIGTIDKFAQVARKDKTAALFGLDSNFRQPDLIIQDELHLISGPLGTLAGLYEVAIDRLCSRDGVVPKIIASTATIRQASTQIRALFNRNTCLFPPPVLDAGNSGFAIEDKRKPGRLYVGVTTAGRSAKFALQAVAGSLGQSVLSPMMPDEFRDDFWTLVAYFNSLRELGGALVLMQDDVTDSLVEYADRRNETARTIKEPLELTSRVSSSEIKEILDELELRWDQTGTCDVLLASNMISVGVDVPRLGMMIVNGQPKGIAEYIQATSRVGRRDDGPGGLIVTIYNNAKSRDRSHYETFRSWHAALYREVEATSVTPFASRARDKGLHAVLVMLARHLVPGLRRLPTTADRYQSELEDFAEYIHERSESIDAEEADYVEDVLADFIERWVNSAGVYEMYWSDWSWNKSLLVSAEKVAEIRARKGTYRGRAQPTPNSMRNVEPGTLYKLEERLKD